MSNNKVAEDLNKNGFRRRAQKKFTRISVIRMLKDKSKYDIIAEI